jgi:hypothetical protein
MNTYLLFDDFIIDSYHGFRKKNFKAQKTGEFYREKITGGHTVIHQREENRYVLLYTTISNYSRDWDRKPFYACSDDGVNFTHQGTLTGMDVPGSFFVNRDDYAEDPRERYKTVVMKVNEEQEASAEGYVAVSPDGLNWNTRTPYRISSHTSDTVNNIFYNPVIKKYQIIYRGAHVDRRITAVFSEDLKSWSDPVLLLSPTPFEEPLTQYYGMVVYSLPGIFLGALQIYHTDPDDPVFTKMVGKTDAALAYSYNGISWSRISRDYFIDRPMPPEFGCSGVYPSNMYESPDGTEWIIGAGSVRVDHGCGFAPAYPDWETPEYARNNGRTALAFYKIRKHGFTGLESTGYNASLRFKRMRFLGGGVTLNISAPCGFVKFQILDEDYRKIPGFAFTDSVPFTGDSVKVTPKWKEKDLAELSGKSIFIEIECRGAVIFSLEGDLKPHHGLQIQESLGAPSVAETIE